MTDIEIAQSVEMQTIDHIAQKAGIDLKYIERYGNYKAKIDLAALDVELDKRDGKLILVTAMTPTPAGEGKTTVTVGLGDGLRQIGHKSIIALREPSLGPVFGVKGGAAGGGYAQVLPMEDINLHFTGDFHAIGAANNLLAAMLDNHIQQGNSLGIDVRRITWKRCVDMNDRQLRFIVDGMGGKPNGTPREDGFDITVASEIMAILCLSTSIDDLKARLAKIVVGYTYNGKPVTAEDLKSVGAMAVLLKDSLKPNLVQTLEGTPTFIHGGPFANIAHGCNSVLATKMALKYGEYVVTEAGFGADLGAEKFLDIKCREANLSPAAVVLVVTSKAIHSMGEVGFDNVKRHYDNILKFNIPCVVAINHFVTDTEEDINEIKEFCKVNGMPYAVTKGWSEGGKGAIELAKEVENVCQEEERLQFTYYQTDSIEEKIEAIVKRVYGGNGVIYSPKAKQQIKMLTELGYDSAYICMAKTQYSFTDNPKMLGAPNDFFINVKDVKLAAGANFIIVLTGDIMTMPGLPKKPAAENIDITNDGKITGLF